MLFLSQMWLQHTLLMEFSFPIRDHITFVKLMCYSRRLGDNMARKSNILFSMLLLCGDVMENPGPSVNEDTPNSFTCELGCLLEGSWSMLRQLRSMVSSSLSKPAG